MRVLISGGAGFIGSHIADACLAKGWTPAAVDDLSTGSRANLPASVKLFEADICDHYELGKVFDEFRPDAVSHQAAQMSVSRSVKDPAFDARVNILGMINVLDHARRAGVKKFVFASSGGVLYGDVPTPASEDWPARPISPYGIAKLAGEHYLQFYVRDFGLRGVALRYANVYGPRQNPHGEAGVVAIFCKKLLAGESPTINGDGKYVRDYVYVEDVARANVAALEASLPDPFTPFNIGTSLGTDVNQLNDLLTAAMKGTLADSGEARPLPLANYGPARAGDLRSNLVSAAKAAAELKWSPQVPLAEGLRRATDWFAKNR